MCRRRRRTRPSKATVELLRDVVDFFLHLDVHVGELIERYAGFFYVILAGILFCETGLVVMPFLPGDSLLFTVGAFAALGRLDLALLLVVMPLAVIAGDNANYWIGRKLGVRAFERYPRMLRRRHLERTQAFFASHGGKTVILARFVPIVRTFTPFVAGLGAMTYPRFIAYSVGGGLLWVFACTLAGYFFGNLEIVKENFSLAVLAIVLISVLPIGIEWLRHRRARRLPT
jgi:membrane-associated protein